MIGYDDPLILAIMKEGTRCCIVCGEEMLGNSYHEHEIKVDALRDCVREQGDRIAELEALLVPVLHWFNEYIEQHEIPFDNEVELVTGLEAALAKARGKS